PDRRERSSRPRLVELDHVRLQSRERVVEIDVRVEEEGDLLEVLQEPEVLARRLLPLFWLVVLHSQGRVGLLERRVEIAFAGLGHRFTLHEGGDGLRWRATSYARRRAERKA